MLNKVHTLPEETETFWYYSKYHIGDWIELYTTDKSIMHRYEKFSQRYPDHCKVVKEDKYSMTFSMHPKCMGFYPKAPRKGPVLTEEQKRANIERLESLRKNA